MEIWNLEWSPTVNKNGKGEDVGRQADTEVTVN